MHKWEQEKLQVPRKIIIAIINLNYFELRNYREREEMEKFMTHITNQKFGVG